MNGATAEPPSALYPEQPTSWAPQVFVDGEWVSNGLRFATEAEADQWAHALLLRWFVPTDARAIPTSDPVTRQ